MCNLLDHSYVSRIRLYISVLGCLKILFKEPDLLVKRISKEQSNGMIFHQIIQKCLSSSPIQTTYEQLELEVYFHSTRERDNFLFNLL